MEKSKEPKGNQTDVYLTLQGLNSKKKITLGVTTVLELVKAYLLVIPNEKRELAMSLQVLRFHDSLRDLILDEQAAANTHMEKKAMDAAAKTLMEETPE